MRPELLARLIIDLLKGLCWHPAISSFNTDNSRGMLRIDFKPAPEDFHLVMGSACQQIQDVQYVAKLIAKNNNYSVCVNVIEVHGEHERRKGEHEFVPTRFDPEEIVRITNGLIASALNRPVKIRVRIQPKTSTLLVEADESEDHVINALKDAVYAYGYRNGCMIKLRRHTEQKVEA